MKLFLDNLRMYKISRNVKYFVSYRLKILNSLKLYTNGLFGWISNKWMTIPRLLNLRDLIKKIKWDGGIRNGRKVGEKTS